MTPGPAQPAAATANGGGTDYLPVVSKFEIQFDAGDGLILHGGELLRGTILVQLNEKTTLQAVKLQIKGRAQWLGDGTAKGEFEKTYFNQDMTLLERPPGRPEAGHFPWIANFLYSLPFECPIPKGCPSTYEGPFGSVRYFVKATLVEEDDAGQRGVMKEHYVKKAFTLLAPSDTASLKHGDGEPVTAEETAFYGKCCCKGKLSAELSLAKSVYAPGDDVLGSLRLNGKRPKAIFDQVEVRLVDRVLRVGTPEKMGASPYRTLVARRLDKADRPAAKGKSPDVVEAVHFLTVPSVPASTRGKFDADTGDLAEMAPNGLAGKQPLSSMYESPSTATLRFRRQPFLRVEYAIQVSIANIIILEAPITVAELPYSGFGTNMAPYVAGAQPIDEASDGGEAFGGPFAYTPFYPIKAIVQREKVPISVSPTAVAAALTSSPAVSPVASVVEERREEARVVLEEPGQAEAAVVREEEENGMRAPRSTPDERSIVPEAESAAVVETISEPEVKTHTEQRVDEVTNDEGEVVGTITTTVTTTESHQVRELSGAGEDAIQQIKERLEDGWAPEEGDEGVESVEKSSAVLHGENGEVIATTTTTKILKRVKRTMNGEEVDGEEEHQSEGEDETKQEAGDA